MHATDRRAGTASGVQGPRAAANRNLAAMHLLGTTAGYSHDIFLRETVAQQIHCFAHFYVTNGVSFGRTGLPYMCKVNLRAQLFCLT